MNDFDVNTDIYKKISGVTDNVNYGFYYDNVAGDAMYYTSDVKESYDTMDKVSYACIYDIKVKIISEYTSNLYSHSKTIKDNLINKSEYLYISYVSYDRSNYYYDPYIKKHTLTLSFTGYVSNE